MSVIKTRPETEFAILSNKVLQSGELSLEAIGLWAHCMSRPVAWSFHVKELCARFDIGREKIYRILNELIKAGFCFRGQNNAQIKEEIAGKRKIFSSVEYVFFGHKLTDEEKQALQNEYDRTDFQKKFPQSGFPRTEKPSAYNRKTSTSKKKYIEESSLTGAKEKPDKPADPPPDSFYKDQFENKIYITTEQRSALVKKFGLEGTIDAYAEKLYKHGLVRPDKFKKYKRHDIVIERWLEKDLKEQELKNINKEKFNNKETSLRDNYVKKLNDIQKENFILNEEVINKLKTDCPSTCAGLYIYFNASNLRHKTNKNVDINILIPHLDFCRYLEKILGLNIVNVRFKNGQIQRD